VNTPGPFWQRRIRALLLVLLTQGAPPDSIALALSVGAVCSVFPFLGLTSLLNLGAGFWLRLNQPLLQTLNQLLGPVQLAMIIGYVRLGGGDLER
jgi:uncharacterized protein (DUF2062 family)